MKNFLINGSYLDHLLHIRQIFDTKSNKYLIESCWMLLISEEMNSKNLLI